MTTVINGAQLLAFLLGCLLVAAYGLGLLEPHRYLSSDKRTHDEENGE